MNKIILTADADFEDHKLREWVSKLFEQIQTLNERTKNHTLQIKELEKRLKSNSKVKSTKSL